MNPQCAFQLRKSACADKLNSRGIHSILVPFLIITNCSSLYTFVFCALHSSSPFVLFIVLLPLHPSVILSALQLRSRSLTKKYWKRNTWLLGMWAERVADCRWHVKGVESYKYLRVIFIKLKLQVELEKADRWQELCIVECADKNWENMNIYKTLVENIVIHGAKVWKTTE